MKCMQANHILHTIAPLLVNVTILKLTGWRSVDSPVYWQLEFSAQNPSNFSTDCIFLTALREERVLLVILCHV